MDFTSVAFLIFIVVVLNAVVLWVIFKNGKDDKDNGVSEGILMMQKELQELRSTMDRKMGETSEKLYESLKTQSSQSQEVIKNMHEQLRVVTKEISEVSESNKKVFDVGEQLQNLEKVLKHQKQRGNLGEASLQLALENILPPTAYKMQYQFPDKEVVDAVIITKDGMIPVDAKFSLDNYRRLVDEKDGVQREFLEKEFTKDLKKRIDETSKYIKPKDGTLPFAFMYIPAEAIYYDLLVNEVGAVKVNTRSLIDYAYKDKNVIIVSPTTFAAYLQSVLYGFRAFKVEESVKLISKNVEGLRRHLNAYDDYFKKVGNSLGTTVNHYMSAQKEFTKIDKDVLRITGSNNEIETLEISKPEKEE